MKSSFKFNFIAGYLTLLSGVISSWIMYSSGGYKEENAHVPLIIGLIGFLFILIIPIVPIVLRILIKYIIESKLFLNFIIVYSVCFGIFQFYFDVDFVNSIILSLIPSLSVLDKKQKETNIFTDIEYRYLPGNIHNSDRFFL